MTNQNKTVALPEKTAADNVKVEVVDKAPSKLDVLTSHVAFLLDRQLRQDEIHGRPSRALATLKRIHSLGMKSVREQEEEAEAKRVADLKQATENTVDSSAQGDN